MAKLQKGIIVFLCVVGLCVLAVGQGRQPARVNQSDESQKIVDPFINSTILLEAFVVEVNLHQLYEMGVCPLGSSPNSVSVDNIMKCLLESKGAEIISGAKLALGQNERGTLKENTTISIIVGNRNESRSGIPEKDFGAIVHILAGGEINVEYSFSMITLQESQEDSTSARTSYSWASNACFKAGMPRIAGAVQDGTNAVFLILTANINDK